MSDSVEPTVQERLRQANLEALMSTVDYWRKEVDLTRTIMGIAIHDFDEARYRLSDAEKELSRFVGLTHIP
jgi:hypothetical protein